MRYCSIAGKSPPVDFSTALFQGLAPDGGLYIPEEIPRLDRSFIDRIEGRSLEEIGSEVMGGFLPEIPQDRLARILREALSFPLPLTGLGERLYLLELFHGPTLAFKDVGARFMSKVMSEILSREHRSVTVLVATSGDTGSAVAQGFFGMPHISVVLLYPSGKVSRLQELQMATLGGNIHAVEVEGTFDDCQRLVKRALVDRAVLAGRTLTTANSINVGRLLPQVIYYVWAYGQWRRARPDAEAPPVVAVPSGNFGNLTACLYAKRMGVPFGTLIAATNANAVVPRYFLTGEYRPQPSIRTLSNAMDVGDPSNVARLRRLCGDDLGKMREEIEAVSFSDEETMAEIRETHKTSGYILDPHTAVGVRAARRHVAEGGDRADCIVAATAHPAKFRETIHQALGLDLPLPDALARTLGLGRKSVKMEASYERFRELLLSQLPSGS